MSFCFSSYVFAAMKESSVPMIQRANSTGPEETSLNHHFTRIGMANHSSTQHALFSL